MAAADVVITGTVLTVDDARPTAEALAVADGRIVAVGSRSDVAGFVGAHTRPSTSVTAASCRDSLRRMVIR